MSQTHSTHSTGADRYQIETSRWTAGRNVLVFVVLVGALASLAGYLTDPARFFRSYLVAFAFTSFIGVAGFFFLQIQFLTGSAWSVTMRRIMENIVTTLPFGLLLFVPVAFGLRYLYPWTDPAVVAGDEALRAKSTYLSPNFFLVRTIVYFVLWSVWIYSIYRQSTRQDTERSIRQMHIASRWSAPGLFLAIAVGTLAAWDWLMSLEPTWYSTIFGLVTISGGGLSFFSVVTLVCLGFRRAGILKNSITTEHYHDLGKWLLTMTAFYTYVAFAQYFLIWYANIPEETQWYRHRMGGSWLVVSLAMPFLRFLIPFFLLLCRPAKRSLGMIAFIAVWSLIVEYIDLYWNVMPVYYKDGPQLHWLDLATLVTTVGVCGLVFWTRLKQHKIVPVGDLRLEQSLHFENA
ncbi:MAG TPA: hypothetical protein VGR73_17750 [Bryobacteraceae bacterium]|nr:hypothetical protein [Bryobacteraceae bacterium]